MIPLFKGPLFRSSLYFVYEMYAVKLSVSIVILFKGTDQIQNTHHDVIMTTKDQIKLENKFVLEFYYFKEQKKLNSKNLKFRL